MRATEATARHHVASEGGSPPRRQRRGAGAHDGGAPPKHPCCAGRGLAAGARGGFGRSDRAQQSDGARDGDSCAAAAPVVAVTLNVCYLRGKGFLVGRMA